MQRSLVTEQTVLRSGDQQVHLTRVFDREVLYLPASSHILRRLQTLGVVPPPPSSSRTAPVADTTSSSHVIDPPQQQQQQQHSIPTTSTTNNNNSNNKPTRTNSRHKHKQKQAPQLRIDPRTTTTAKAQALALLCAPVVANRRIGPNPPSPSPSSSSSLSRASPHLCGSSSTMVSPALVEWAQSTALARQWAKDWVLRPTTQVVFALPISEPFWMVPDGHRSFVCVSVSPTLGLVSSHWFKLLSNEQVSGCVGDGRVLVDLSPHDCGEIRRFSIMDVVPRGVGVHSRDTAVGDNGGPIGMRYQVYTEQLLEASSSLKCNRRWIVGVWRCKKICVWKVHSSDGDCGGVKVSEERQFKVVDVAEALFSPLCDDVLVTFNEVAEVMEFIDLEASFSGKNLVVKSRQQCKLGQLLKGILWMPDGSTCTLGGWSRAENILIDTTTRKEVNFFPYEMDVTPVGSHHVLAVTLMPCTEFQVYSTSNLTTPSLRVPCTWASASDPTGLIASTRHQSEGAKATEIKFALHDGATGFHIGDFTIPVPKTFHFLGC